MNKQLLLNVEFRVAGQEYVSLYDPDSKDDIAKGLITQGLVLAEPRKEKRFAKLITEYAKAQEKAKANRVSVTDLLRYIWEHEGLVATRSSSPN